MRSTPHHDPAADAPTGTPAVAAETTAPETTTGPDAPLPGAAPNAPAQKLDAAVAQGKNWLQSFDSQQLLEQIPQPVRDLGAQVADRVRRLSPTQQIVGGAVLAFGVGLLATRNGHKARTADAKAGKKYRAKYD